MKTFILALTVLCSPLAFAEPTPHLHGVEVSSGQNIDVTPKAEGTVIVFFSSSCPCSNSHVEEVKSLAAEYPQFAFVGVHSNADETAAEAKTYFDKNHMNFPVIQDDHAKIADQFKALKTPHAFVLSADGKVLYQGGVSSSKDIKKADRKYLREALTDLKNHVAVKTPEGRTLGCTISRGEKNVW
jgi:peroxiredoxin